MPELTEASAAEYDNILHGKMTPAIAAQYLREGRIVLRTFGDVLREVYPAPDILSRLSDFFSADDPGASQQSVQRKIRNWIADKHPPQNREDIYKIAFALSLDESQLNHLLGMCGDYGIQYRDCRELVLSWHLRHGMSYGEALEFYAGLPEMNSDGGTDDVASQITQQIHYLSLMAQNQKDLKDLIYKNSDKFGKMHLRAFFYFDRFLNQLTNPTGYNDAHEEIYSAETVMNVYLSMHMPSSRKRDNYSLVQKLVKKNWPNATSIKNIRGRKEDVSRKLLLLLYVVTENEGIVMDNYDYYDETLTLEQRVEDHWYTINAMLNDCGMVPLDPRNASDWLILYAVSTDDEDTPMSERLEQVIKFMFDDSPDEDESAPE